MLKIKSIFMSLLVLGALASCSNDNEIIQEGGDERDYGVAYMSIGVSTPKQWEHVLPERLMLQKLKR